jgi:hypothetical protein
MCTIHVPNGERKQASTCASKGSTDEKIPNTECKLALSVKEGQIYRQAWRALEYVSHTFIGKFEGTWKQSTFNCTKEQTTHN